MSGIKKMLLNFEPQTGLLPQTLKKKKKKHSKGPVIVPGTWSSGGKIHK